MKNMYVHQRLAFAFCFFLSLFSFNAFAQVGIGTLTPESTLDVRAVNHNGAVTANDGILAPRVSSLLVAGSQDGQLVYLIADVGNLKKGFYSWNSTAWRPLAISGSPIGSEFVVQPDVIIPGTPTPVISFTVSPNTPIIDNTAFNTLIPVSGIIGNTTFVSIQINITHTFDADLDIFLQSPTGQILELTSDNGGAGDNYTNTLFSDLAPQNISIGIAPFLGSYLPEGTTGASGFPVNLTGTITTLAGFNGVNPNGNWTLRIGDDFGGDVGTFISATLNISGNTPANWVMIGEVSIPYFNGSALILQSTYSADPLDLNGVVTALTRSTATVPAGSTAAALPGTVRNYASASPSGTGNVWVNTFNHTRDISLVDNTLYFYQLWRKGNIETPVNLNETFSLVPMRMEQ